MRELFHSIVATCGGHGLELGDTFEESEFHHPSRPISVLGDQNFGHTRLLAVFIVVIIAVDEHDDVGVLLNGPRVPQVAHHGAFVVARLNASVEL